MSQVVRRGIIPAVRFLFQVWAQFLLQAQSLQEIQRPG